MDPRSTPHRIRSRRRTTLSDAPRVRRHPHSENPDPPNDTVTAFPDRHQRLTSWGTALTGAAAVAALLFTGIASYQTQNELESRTRELKIAEQGQISDRFTRAVSQLDDKSVDVRLGSLYALQRIMKDSHDDQPAVINVLAAYIRTHSGKPSEHPCESRDEPAEEDILAAAKILGDRDPEYDAAVKVDLHDTNLRGADLRRADLHGADLRGADLHEANLDQADLRESNLDQADLHRADLRRDKPPWSRSARGGPEKGGPASSRRGLDGSAQSRTGRCEGRSGQGPQALNHPRVQALRQERTL